MAKRDHLKDKDQDLDPAGAHGGDTGKSSFKGDGPRRRRVTSAATTPSTAARPAAARRGRAASTTSAPAPRATPRSSKGRGAARRIHEQAEPVGGAAHDGTYADGVACGATLCSLVGDHPEALQPSQVVGYRPDLGNLAALDTEDPHADPFRGQTG